MVKITDKDYYIDGYLNSNLKLAKTTIHKDWDMIFCVDGPEGSGKSVLTMQMAYDCDPSFNNSRVCFTPSEFRKAILTANKYQAVVYDEAYTGLSSRATMSLINRTLISMLAEIRQRNLFVFIVMPTFFDLDKYVALWRSRALIHVYIGKNFQRGFFSFYNMDLKKDLYIKGKKFYSYFTPKPNFKGRFTNFYVTDEKEYKKKKKESLIFREKKAEEREKKAEVEKEMFIRLMELKEDIPHSIKMKVLAMPHSTYFRKVKQYNELKSLE